MKVNEILKSVHVAYEQAADAPALNDEDGQIRLNLLQKAVRRWSTDNVTKWNELFSVGDIGPIQPGQREYDLPEGYSLSSGFYLQGSSEPLRVKSPSQLTGEDGKFVTILGNPQIGHKLRLGWMPKSSDQEIDKTIIVKYYREPFIPTKLDDVLEMSDPNFAIAYVTAELFVNDDANLYTKYNSDAMILLANMRQRNELVPDGQFSGLEGDIGIGGDW